MEIVDLFTQPNLYQLPEKFELFKASGYYKRYYIPIQPAAADKFLWSRYCQEVIVMKPYLTQQLYGN